MSSDLSLFGEDESREALVVASDPAPVADWQIDLLRKALDARGLTTMLDRQQAIEEAAERPVQSLRALTHDEALRVLTRLGPPPAAKPGTGSAWDLRDEDTWIDRL